MEAASLVRGSSWLRMYHLDAGLAVAQSSLSALRSCQRNRGNFCLINDIGFGIFRQPGRIKARAALALSCPYVVRDRPLGNTRRLMVMIGRHRGIHLFRSTAGQDLCDSFAIGVSPTAKTYSDATCAFSPMEHPSESPRRNFLQPGQDPVYLAAS